jgi:flagellar biosynthesis chaperone FliJ
MTSSSLPLFDDGPGKDFSVSEVLARRKPADKAQQRFRRLVANIERKRGELRQWQAYQQRYNQRITTEVEPVRLELLQQQRQMAVLIDELLSQRGQSRRLSRLERAKLQDILMTLLDAVLSQGDDEALAVLRVKHTRHSAKEDQRLEMELTESLLTDVLGLEVDENHGASSRRGTARSRSPQGAATRTVPSGRRARERPASQAQRGRGCRAGQA